MTMDVEMGKHGIVNLKLESIVFVILSLLFYQRMTI